GVFLYRERQRERRFDQDCIGSLDTLPERRTQHGVHDGDELVELLRLAVGARRPVGGDQERSAAVPQGGTVCSAHGGLERTVHRTAPVDATTGGTVAAACGVRLVVTQLARAEFHRRCAVRRACERRPALIDECNAALHLL